MDVQTLRNAGEVAPATEAQTQLATRAETLLRSVIGIACVRVIPHPAGGIAVVRATCDDTVSNGQLLRNIRSALFAGLGISVAPECIDLCASIDGGEDTLRLLPDSAVAAETSTTDSAGDVRPAVHFPTANPPIQHEPMRPRVATAAPRGGSSAMPAAAFANMSTVATFDIGHRRTQRILQVVADEEAKQEAAVSQPAPSERSALGQNVRSTVASAAPLRLESVELRRQSGRLRCRVVISLGSDHFGAVADTTDPHAGEIHLAGRVACDALRAGGFTDARFDGAAVAQINGRQHVVVALSEWLGGETLVLSGAAPLENAPERAAAIAAIKAVLAQDIN